jgi:hypothetical protein
MKLIWDGTACARCGCYVRTRTDRSGEPVCTLCESCAPPARPRDQLRRLFRITAQRNAEGRVVYVRE